ncbi:MAG: hypothetical protein FJ041_07725, partial [Candidatus Cloacimonetes bacterium]|nr:hypothetical protein [Candidatus Cloacimonadota bacterium]
VQLNNSTNNINMNLEYLPPPIGFTWTALTDQVEFRWGIETRPAFQHYNIYRKIGTGAWGLINETTQNYYTELLTQQTWYEYKVTSDYITSESMPTQTIRVYYPNNNNQIPPTAPNIVSIIKDENYVTITWEPVTTDTSGVIMVPWEYRIYSDDTLDFIPSQDNFVCSVLTNSVVIPIIPSRKVSYYIVRAFIGYSD